MAWITCCKRNYVVFGTVLSILGIVFYSGVFINAGSFKMQNNDTMSETEYNILKYAELLEERLNLITDGDKPVLGPCTKDGTKTEGLCYSENCARPLEARTAEERVRDLLTSPALRLSEDQLLKIMNITKDIPESDVIFATASSANHYNEMQALFQNLHETVFPKLKSYSVVVVDLGLSKHHKNETEDKCGCQVVTFPFHLFPPHVKDLKCFAWKAMLIRALLPKARKLLVYQDTSVRWNHHFKEVFERATKYGHQTFATSTAPGFPIRTVKQTFQYMGEDACPFRGFREALAGIQVMKNDSFIIDTLLTPWARCALEPACIRPQRTDKIIGCHEIALHGCHRENKMATIYNKPGCNKGFRTRVISDAFVDQRFDQSALSLLMAKLYGVERDKLNVPQKIFPLNVRRGHRVNYFQELEDT